MVERRAMVGRCLAAFRGVHPLQVLLSRGSVVASAAAIGLLGCAQFGYELLTASGGGPNDGGSAAGVGGAGSDAATLGGTGGSTPADAGGGAAGGSNTGGSNTGGSNTGGSSTGGSSTGGTDAGALPIADAAPSADAAPEGDLTCSDGARSAGEDGVDCGGPYCVPCPCVWGAPEVLGDPNYAGNQLYSPSLSDDGLELFFGFVIPGFAEQVGRSTRASTGAAFGLGSVVASPVSTGVEGNAHLSADARSLYFYSQRAGGAGAQDLYVATRANRGASFNSAAALTALNSASTDQLPWTTDDGLTLYFVSNRSGNSDLWRSTRVRTADAFGAPVAVSELNSSAGEGKLTLSPDQRVALFSSDRPGGLGGNDIYSAVRVRTDQPFGSPTIVAELSTAQNEYDPEISRDGRWVYFATPRGGSDSRVWRASRTCPP